jgi:PAS domain S-box-containing protein
MVPEELEVPPDTDSGTDAAAAEVEELRRRLDEALHTLDAIQNGSVDAVVVNGPNGPQIFTLESPDQPFRTFVEGMREGALTLGSDGVVLYANTFFAELVERPVAEVVGAHLSTFVIAGHRGSLALVLEQGLSDTVKHTLRLETPGGGVPVQITLSPLSRGDYPTCCAVVVDLREREQAERARAAREAAEEANAAKDRFLAVLGHELRSPLNTVLGWAQILAGRSDLDATVQKAVKTIERNARAQAQLISDLLDVSRIVAGKLHFEFEVVDLKAIAASVVAASKLTLDKPMNILFTAPESDTFVLGDATRLQQVVTNLLNNAVKFTERGGRVEVQLERTDRYVQLTVIDTGVGIAPDELENIFELFQQSALSQRKGGLGLGLSISKQLVEAHGGQIRVQSPGVGLGSTFSVRLPRVTSAAPSPEEDSVIESQLDNRRILVLDDDADILELVRYALEHRGARVDTVQTAAAALDSLAVQRYDVLVSDLGLPEKDGLTLMREVRAQGRELRELRTVALTGYASEADAQLCREAGFDLHLVKPISPWELARSITRLLEQPIAKPAAADAS